MRAERGRAGGWRDADLRGGHGPPPSSVEGVVRATRLALAVARWGESFLFFLAGACVTMAAAVLSGVTEVHWEVFGVALLGGLCSGLTWGITHFVGALEVARALDRKLRHQGGLLTAYELETRAGDSATSMSRLVIERTKARLRSRQAVRALLPSLTVPVASPILGAALLAFALESRRPAELPDDLDLGGIFGGMAQALGSSYTEALNADERGTLDSETARTVMSLVRRVEGLERRPVRLDEDPEDLRTELDELDRSLAEVAPRLAAHPDLARAVDAARNWLDAARMGLSGRERQDLAAGVGPGLTDPGADGTMSGPTGRGTGAAGGPAPPRGGDEARPQPAVDPTDETPTTWSAGTVAESWWPAEYDDIVAGWVELRRTLSSEER